MDKEQLAKFVGSKIKEFRTQRNMTQEELAELMDTTKQSIGRYENGSRRANQDNIFDLADIFNRSINDFFPPTKTSNYTEKINNIVIQLREPRQIKVFDYAESELEEQHLEEEYYDDYHGQTAAGVPIEGQQPVPFIGAKTVNLLVNGDSMEPQFYDGDIIKYHPQPELENGEIGVFAVNGGITMKKFRKNSDIRLESLNKKYQDIVIKETDDFNILGKVIL